MTIRDNGPVADVYDAMGERHVAVMQVPQMVTCRSCGLLLGWTEGAPVAKPIYCIPCFDKVQVKPLDGRD